MSGGRVVASSNLVIPTNRKGIVTQQFMRLQCLFFLALFSRIGNKKNLKTAQFRTKTMLFAL